MSAPSEGTGPSSVLLPFESRRRARNEKREAVLRTAAIVFLELGYHRATLTEVAERLNITKPALYNYVTSKEEILFECWMLGLDHVEMTIADISAAGGDALFQLRQLIRAYGEIMTTDHGAALVRFDERDLDAEHGRVVRAARRRIDRTFRNYITKGVADGLIEPCNVKLTTFAVVGSLNWIGYWYQQNGGASPSSVAEEFTRRLIDGIAKRR